MAGMKQRVTDKIAEVRERRPFVDHLVLMQEHYGGVKAGQQAGAVTYFGFLSFFPILALAFAVVGFVARVYPQAKDTTREAIEQIFPGMIGDNEGQIALADIESAAGAAIGFGLLGVLYAGLGWLSSLRDALLIAFELPTFERPNFVMGKLRDLITLATVGTILILSVAVSGLVRGFSEQILDLLRLGIAATPFLYVLSIAIGLVTSTVLFLALFRLLADPQLPRRSLISGALFGAIGFEILKQLSSTLLKATEGQPAFQAFGIALILVVWINYFSRVVLYAAAFAHTTAEARAARDDGNPDEVQGPQVPSLVELPAIADETPGAPGTGAAARSKEWAKPFAAGGAAMLALVAVFRRPGEK